MLRYARLIGLVVIFALTAQRRHMRYRTSRPNIAVIPEYFTIRLSMRLRTQRKRHPWRGSQCLCRSYVPVPLDLVPWRKACCSSYDFLVENGTNSTNHAFMKHSGPHFSFVVRTRIEDHVGVQKYNCVARTLRMCSASGIRESEY